MYKPPINTNRVKYMRSKFENNETENTDFKLINSITNRKPKTINNLQLDKKCNEEIKRNVVLKRDNTSIDLKTNQTVLARQLSDPLNKCNIKRTPAFRLEKNPSTHKAHKSNFLESKIKIFDQRLNQNCDNDANFNIKLNNSTVSCDKANTAKSPEEKLDDIIKQHDSNEEVCYANIKYLYAEPIPKAFRHKNTITNNDHDTIKNNLDDIHKTTTLKLQDISNENEKNNSITKQKSKLIKTKAIDLCEFETFNLTETLKTALKRPLPTGPAPKKPPRTFLHSPKADRSPENDMPLIENLNLSESFTKELNKSLKKSLLTNGTKTKTKSKNDPMYMLNKLENALKNNKIRLKRQAKFDNTSGEESDSDVKSEQALLSNSNSSSSTSNHIFNLNCLSALTCTNTKYERIKEPNSSFFLKCDEEPVYAIPFENSIDLNESTTDIGNSNDSENSNALKRNSLYYMVSNR